MGLPRTEVTKKIWAYIKKNSLSAGRETLSEPRPFSRRVPTSRRALESRPQELRSCKRNGFLAATSDYSRVSRRALHALAEAKTRSERCSHDGERDYVRQASSFFRKFSKMSTVVP